MLNIGVINCEIFKLCVDRLLQEEKSGTKILDDFVCHCQKNPAIGNMSIVFERLENTNILDIQESRSFVIDTLSIIKGMTRSQYQTALIEHGKFARKVGLLSNKLRITELQKAIATLIRYNLYDCITLDKEPRHKAMMVVIEHITRKIEKEEIKEQVLRTKYHDEKMILSKAIKLFNDEYRELLESHSGLFEVLRKNDVAEITKYFEEIILTTNNTILEILSRDNLQPILRENLSLAYDKFKSKEIKELTTIDVSQMLQLTNQLNHLSQEIA